MTDASSGSRLRPRERDAILQSLRAGVVPRTGQRHIQVGRASEVKALLGDLDRLSDGGSAVRFVIGEYGSGKTFFLHLVRSLALEKRLVTAHADLSPGRRLHATGGQARSLYAELMRNLATRANPEGGALASVVERFVTAALGEARERGVQASVVLQERLNGLSELVGGYDFAEVVGAYWRGHDSGDEVLKAHAIRWLRGEYSTRTDARSALGVRTIVDDANFYDQLKLLAQFVRMAGFGGLLIALDELVNLYKLANTQARNANYEQILRILNDALQGTAVGLGFLFGGTPEFLLDTRRGLYSYPALQSRLAENTFATGGLVDFSGPVLRLANLTPEDVFVLLGKLRHVYASGDPADYLLTDDALTAFMEHCAQRIGDAYFRTPRTTIKEFVNLLAVLDQNRSVTWRELVAAVDLTPEANPDLAPLRDEAPPSGGPVEAVGGDTDDDSPPSASEGASHRAFDRLHQKVQQWVWRQGWKQLRPAQVAAAAPILDGDRDVIISAATAAGKTEAAFLPICSALLHAPAAAPGVEVLCISPLKALINDQHERLEDLCAEFDVAVHRWHGDVGSNKKTKLLKAPSGILLITPESLEALFVLHGTEVAALLAGLRYVVVDELHAFIGTERGAQLQSLLHRVELVVRDRIPRIALSATLGDLPLAAEFLRPGAGSAAVLIQGDDDGQELQLQLRGYRVVAPLLDAKEAIEAEKAGVDVTAEQVTRGDKVAIAAHLFKVLRGTDNLVFANARRDVEIYADLLTAMGERSRLPNQFFPHHGSLSKDLREHVEARLKGADQPISAICTSTLEMGIDIGDVESIAQIGSPPSVASLRQRLGRSGRRGGPAVLRIYVTEREITEKMPPPDWLRVELVQSIAMVRLLLGRWIEPPSVEDLHLSTLVQQTLSLIAQHGGVTAPDAYGALCGHGPFQRVTRAMFVDLLRSLAASELIFQSADNTLLLDVTGERIVNHYTFYAAFTTPEEYRLVADGRQLGSIPVDSPILPGALLIFAGRRWRVLSVDDRQKVIDLERSPAGRPPLFAGAGSSVHDRVRAEMLAVYHDAEVPVFLDTGARELLAEARDNFARMSLDRSTVIASGDDTVVFPWVGDRIIGTLAALLTAGGLEVANDGIALTIANLTPEAFAAELAVLVPGGSPDPVELAAVVPNKEAEKFDCYLGDDLLNAGYAARSLDPSGAWAVLEDIDSKLRHEQV